MAVYFIKHTKADEIKFVSHLDLQKALQRNLTRAGLKVAFSQGFNPHMLMSSAQPLSVGVSSEAEYLVVELQDEPEEALVQQALNDTAPAGIRYLLVRRMPQGMAAPMALLDAVETRLRIPSTQEFAQGIAGLLQSGGPMAVISKNKKGVEKERDLRPMLLPGATVSYEDGFTRLTLKTRAGSRSHLNLDHLVQYFGEQVEGLAKGRFIHLKRLEMFTLKDDCFISLGEI